MPEQALSGIPLDFEIVVEDAMVLCRYPESVSEHLTLILTNEIRG